MGSSETPNLNFQQRRVLVQKYWVCIKLSWSSTHHMRSQTMNSRCAHSQRIRRDNSISCAVWKQSCRTCRRPSIAFPSIALSVEVTYHITQSICDILSPLSICTVGDEMKDQLQVNSTAVLQRMDELPRKVSRRTNQARIGLTPPSERVCQQD